MLDANTGAAALPDHTDTLTADLCVVGAGIAGMNALYVATDYLPKGTRVVVIDRKPGPGGMWNSVYDYVRLHQPHPMFTTGDVKWQLGKPADYLATQGEVQAHLNHCMDIIRAHLDLVELYGHEFDTAEEQSENGATTVHITCHDAQGRTRTIAANRMINAAAFDIPVPEPLTLSSRAVTSITPQTLTRDAFGSDAPAYIIGGGKTGMDTALALMTENPNRKIVLLNGQGTVFAKRDLFFPTTMKERWFGGQLLIQSFRDATMRFDGTNADEVYRYFTDSFCISPDGSGEQFFFGLLSEDEANRLNAGLSETIGDYLEDVIDTAEGPAMVLRKGGTRHMEPGAIVLNCTGHVLRHDQPEAQLLSDKGAILSINAREAIHFLTSVSGYFLTHLFLSDKLKEAPLYVLDLDTLRRKDRKVWQMSAATLSFMNAIVLIDTLPFKVMDRCGLDMDRWYPLWRRMGALIDIKRNRTRYLDHCRKVLDRIARDYDVRSGPML